MLMPKLTPQITGK